MVAVEGKDGLGAVCSCAVALQEPRPGAIIQTCWEKTSRASRRLLVGAPIAL